MTVAVRPFRAVVPLPFRAVVFFPFRAVVPFPLRAVVPLPGVFRTCSLTTVSPRGLLAVVDLAVLPVT